MGDRASSFWGVLGLFWGGRGGNGPGVSSIPAMLQGEGR